MRRDVGFYLEADVEQVYLAYLNAATHKPFLRECKQEPFHTISFGLNYSFKYNMNGGACTLRFMPYGSGTAVNMRFSIAQGVGARYNRYAEELNRAMQAFLPVLPTPASYDVEEFLKPENQKNSGTAVQSVVKPVTSAPVSAPATPSSPVSKPASAPVSSNVKYCSKCGKPYGEGVRFCTNCGTPTAALEPKHCPNCNKTVKEGHLFCSSCGTKL